MLLFVFCLLRCCSCLYGSFFIPANQSTFSLIVLLRYFGHSARLVTMTFRLCQRMCVFACLELLKPELGTEFSRVNVNHTVAPVFIIPWLVVLKGIDVIYWLILVGRKKRAFCGRFILAIGFIYNFLDYLFAVHVIAEAHIRRSRSDRFIHITEGSYLGVYRRENCCFTHHQCNYWIVFAVCFRCVQICSVEAAAIPQRERPLIIANTRPFLILLSSCHFFLIALVVSQHPSHYHICHMHVVFAPLTLSAVFFTIRSAYLVIC